jgi:asparaginyl-tRNA synthetase
LKLAEVPFVRITYTDAIEVLSKHLSEKKVKFSVKPVWGMDMGSEHERYLAEKVYGQPIMVYNYPKAFKAFYMKQNEDGKTVQAMDMLVPGIGELIGGSAREENLEKLDAMIKEKNLEIESYWWYRELRKYGTNPHGGFGLGFERLVMMCTGVENIRDVIPFPRIPNKAEF